MRNNVRRIVTGIVAAGALGAAAPAAHAEVFCFPNVAVDDACDAAPGSIQQALTAAQNQAGSDTVLLGPGNFTIPPNQGYSDATPGNTVEIAGKGTGATTLTLSDTMGANTAMIFSAGTGSSMHDISFVMPANQDAASDRMLHITGEPTVNDITVTGPDASNAIGILTGGDPLLSDIVVDLEANNPNTNFAVRSDIGEPRVRGSLLVADSAVSTLGTGASLEVERSTLRGRTGIDVQAGQVIARNTVIELDDMANSTGIRAENPNEGTSPMNVIGDHLTIVGGGPQSAGIIAIGDSNGGPPDPFNGVPGDTVDDGETADVHVSNSVISGPTLGVFAGTDRGEQARITLRYSNLTAPAIEDDDLSNGDANGTATLTQENNLSFADPGFLDPGNGDYRLSGTSPLIDKGDPVLPAPGDLDRQGNPRATVAPVICGAPAGPPPRRDIGAYEFVPNFPVAQCPPAFVPGPETGQPASSKKKCKKAKKKKAKRGATAQSAAKAKCKRKKKRRK